jgi:steroid 5-alpha reductase family enzyme
MIALAASAAIVSIGMVLLWLVGRRIRNMALVDVGWAAGIGVAGAVCALLSEAPPTRRVLIALMAVGWGGRLATHLLRDRVLGHEEEGRYQELRARWGARADGRFFVFFQAQAVLVIALAIPFALAAANRTPRLHPLELSAPALLLLAVIGESIADAQLRRFKGDPAHRGRTCRTGLWRYSRHPNYFFEWLAWIAFAMLSFLAPHGWIGLASPAIMLVLLLFVTGIPPTEAQSIRSRGDDYRRYQRETSAFIPWFPRASERRRR